ncbi:Ribonuclease H domain-containing protein [Hirschfeldia incana]|nr:Ribonuclease H domain-containing protein [Hirschfeldia incana]
MDNELELARQKLEVVESSTYRLYSKGLVSEEVIKDDTMLVGGSGLSLCDSNNNSKLETNKALPRNRLLLAHPEAVELAAIFQGLSWALELGVKYIQFFCDDSIILDYVTREAAPPPNESIVVKLLKQVALLKKKFTSCQALPLRTDINSSVIKLARDAIASQTTWRGEGDDTNTEYETCPACYAHVSPRHKLEVSSGCFHRICFTCIRDCVSSQLARGDTLLCPYPGCDKELVLEDCRGIADDDALNLIIHRKKEKAIPVSDRVYCPKPSCNFLMSDRDLPLGFSIDPRQKSVARTCVECGLCFCKKCHVPWHYKKTCDEFKKSPSYLTSDAALLESLVKTQGWMKCPQCATVVQKNGGCQRISCRHCNHKFCYACGAACTRKKMSCNCSPEERAA